MAKQATALKDVEQVSIPRRDDVISAENVHEISLGKRLALSFQHVFAMFGATVLVPKVTGLNPAVTLFAAGVGTLLFHQVTKRKVPVFLGSSFAFMGAIQVIGKQYGLPYATGGIAVAGAFLALMSFVVALLGVERVKSLFPPIVTGPMIMVIGLTLSPTAISMASENWLVASIVLLTMILVSTFAKGFFKLVPIVISIAVGYIASVAMGLVKFQAIADASWFALPPFVAPKFSWAAIA
ncbi:MAG: uracil-xanthine permease family protein, partial [Bacillota bacterium]